MTKITIDRAIVEQEPVGRTDQQIVDQTEELAVWLLHWAFSRQPETPTPMRESRHPMAERCWAAACHIQEMLTATDPENAVSELDGEAPEDTSPQPAQQQEPKLPEFYARFEDGLVSVYQRREDATPLLLLRENLPDKQPAQQEPVDFASLLREAEEIVREKPTWKRFIDGTPLANDIAVWMTVFAQDVARRTSPQPAQQPVQEPATLAGYDLDAISEGLAEAQVVYQISMKDGAASSAWIDVDEAAYNSAKLYGEFDCRCLYIAPPQHAELADHSEHKHYEVRA